MVMHRDLLGPDSMHYEHFNCIHDDSCSEVNGQHCPSICKGSLEYTYSTFGSSGVAAQYPLSLVRCTHLDLTYCLSVYQLTELQWWGDGVSSNPDRLLPNVAENRL